MKLLLSVLLFASSVLGLTLTETPRVKPKDLNRLVGTQWTGALTYTDYRSNKSVSIRSNLTVSQVPANQRSWVFDYQYPDEPKANSKATVTISKDGTILNDEKVVARMRLDDDGLRVVTEKTGSDNNKNAVFRYTYEWIARNFSIRKEVKYEGTNEFFLRNQYSWKR